MKFSVLLPTRNRLDFLSYAIETVVRQDYSDWEIIISDNCSEENIENYVKSLNDPRIKYYCTKEFIPVTENWNNALAKSDGDYVIMLGDDDCLMQGYFSKLRKMIEENNAPDLIYTSALLYAYPGVIPGHPEGFLRSYSHSRIFRSAQKPFFLEKSEAVTLVNNSVDFRMHFDYNMQFSLVSRKLIQEMKTYGSFYQSPYPDYYSSNAILVKAKNVLIVPEPLVVIGISPKSFGFYYFNNLEKEGNKFLKNDPDYDMALSLQKVILPGTDMNTSWLFSMETLVQNFGNEMTIKVNYNRYRFLQICAVYVGLVLDRQGNKSVISSLKRKVTMREQIFYVLPLSCITVLSLVIPKRYHASIVSRIINATGSHLLYIHPQIKGKYSTILDVFEKIVPACDLIKKAGIV